MRGDPTRTAYGPASGLSAGDLPGSTACSAARRAVRGVLRRFRRERVAGTAQAPGGFGNVGRWAYLGLNQGPPACEAGALPLSYTPGKRPGMLADGGCAPAEPTPPRTEWEGFEPSRRVNPAHAISSRAPSAARTPLQAVPSIARRSAGKARQRFSRSERLFATVGACAGWGGSRSFRLAPSASRSRLKLSRGTEAFRGNGTLEGWTKRQAFGHFVFGSERAIRRVSGVAPGRRRAFPAASGFSRSGRLAQVPLVPLLSVSHRALSRKQTKLRRGAGSPPG